jgi:integrase
MPQGRISKRSVDALACPLGKDREILWDDDLSGFGVVVFPTGRKVYVAQYRQHGRSRRTKLGEHGKLTPDEARSEAKKTLGAVETGADPIEERRAAREVRTFAAVAEDFMNLYAATRCKPRTQVEYRRWLDRHLLPALGARRVPDIQRLDLARLHGKLAATPTEANHVHSLFRVIWNWAARRGEVDGAANPANGVERFREKSRERFLTSDELSRLGTALAEGETIGLPWAAVDETKPKTKHAPKEANRRTLLDPFAVAAIRLLLLTGARRREILDAKWSDVDLERGILFLPDSKTGRKPVYLSAAAKAVLSGIPRVAGNPHVIPGTKDGGPRADLNRPWAAVTRAAGLEGVRLHDLRHSFASFGAGASLGLPIIGKLLGHNQAATTQRYAHLDADPLRRAVDTIGATIAAAMDGNKDGAKVVPLKRSRGDGAA